MNRDSIWTTFFIYLAIFFVIPIIGTLLHEVGHFLVAVIYGQPAGIAYGYTYIIGPSLLTPEQYFWFIVGGPFSTWAVALLGLTVILVLYRSMHSEPTERIGVGQTLAIVGAAFSLRFIFNAGGYLLLTIQGIPSNADEVKIANYLGNSPDLAMYGSAVLGLVFVLLALYYIPTHQRYVILVAGIIGGALGYIFWYYWAGPILLPLPP